MHREGIDPENVQPEDILCDYCGEASWSQGKPSVEGHQGSIVCGTCLTEAFIDLVLHKTARASTQKCRMCLEPREDPIWLGSFEPNAPICKRCVKQSAGVLTKSKHWDWSKPTEP
jgi:formylmethanofuran dehydrogenase subunit E